MSDNLQTHEKEGKSHEWQLTITRKSVKISWKWVTTYNLIKMSYNLIKMSDYLQSLENQWKFDENE